MRFANTFNEGLILGNEPILKGIESQPVEEFGQLVEEINKELLKENIFGGKDLSHDFPELGQCALYCVSEITTLEEMEHLRDALKRIVKGE